MRDIGEATNLNRFEKKFLKAAIAAAKVGGGGDEATPRNAKADVLVSSPHSGVIPVVRFAPPDGPAPLQELVRERSRPSPVVAPCRRQGQAPCGFTMTKAPWTWPPSLGGR